MDGPPDVLEALQIPQARPARGREPDLFGQICDLPVMPDVVVHAEARIFRVVEDEQVKKARNRGGRGDCRGPAPVEAWGFGISLRRYPLGLVEPPILLLFAGKDLRQESPAVADSAATCSVERATSTMHRSEMSRRRRPSKRHD